jgi:glucose/arabinose dehydrogenase
MRRLAAALAAAALLTITAGSSAQVGSGAEASRAGSGATALRAGSGEGPLRLAPLGTFNHPVHVSGAPGFPRLLFVVEQPGVVRVLRRGRLLPRPFLDISSQTICGSDPDDCGEQGLLSIAFPSNYKKTRLFYVYFTGADGNNRVVEFRRSRKYPAQALPGSQRPVLFLPHPNYENHNGGGLAFHGSKELFITTGDGGLGGDPTNNAQNRDSLLGKILRINPRRARSGRPYGVPRSNPFVGRAGLDAIFSIGLRNPFRIAIENRRRAPDRILVGDVGQQRYEEINYVSLPVARGANFGWDAYEGAAPYDCEPSVCPLGGTPAPAGLVPPIFTYGHPAYAAPEGPSGCSVTSGVVVRDETLVPLVGRALFADYCEGQIRSLIPRLTGAQDEGPTGLNLQGVSSFGDTPDGRVFVTSLDGGVFRIAPG